LKLNRGTNADRSQVSASRIIDNGFGVLYMNGTDIWWQAINFIGDTQILGTATLMASTSVGSYEVIHSPNMDCLGFRTMSRLSGICLVTYTFSVGTGTPQEIHLKIINESGNYTHTPQQLASSSGQEQLNSMVALTGDSYYVTTFITRLGDGS
jgi:hypothetical protein